MVSSETALEATLAHGHYTRKTIRNVKKLLLVAVFALKTCVSTAPTLEISFTVLLLSSYRMFLPF